jgi:carotenoid cleavage dioxygenase-like enzyme
VYPSEPIFVSGAVADSGNSGASGDRDSWLIFPVFLAETQRSEVWIVPADRVEEGAVCRLALPEIVPIGFHGTWHAMK